MYSFIKQAHSGLAYLALIVLSALVIYFIISLMSKKTFTEGHKKFALVGLVVSHLQLLFGLILYFTSPLGFSNLSGETMKNSMMRLYAVEHPIVNILAIVMITIGYSRIKRLIVDQAKHRTVVIFYGIALILILSRIPWGAWLGL